MSQHLKLAPTEATGLWSLVRAFRHRNFRLYFGGNCVSLAGSLMQGVALTWVVYQLTNSALLLGLVGFAGQIPLFLFTPLAGVFVDRYNRHRIILITQILLMILAFILAILAYSHHLTVWAIIAISSTAGTILAVDMPSRQSFLVDLVGRGPDLSNAVAMNSFAVNSSKIIGPAAAGLLLIILSPSFCFLLNGLSFLAVIGALMAMRLRVKTEPRGHAGPAHRELLEGWNYAWRSAPIRAILLLVALTGVTAAAHGILLPIFAVQVFHGGAHTLGILMAAPGIGALASGVYLASRRTVLGAEIQIAGGAIVCGLGLLVFSFSSSMPLSLFALLFVGWGMVIQFALSNTVIQTLVDNDKRGRVMSLFTTALMGMGPFGSLLGGALAHKIGAPATVAICGLATLAGGIFFALKLSALQQFIIPIYQARGIIPQTDPGLGDVSDLPNLP